MTLEEPGGSSVTAGSLREGGGGMLRKRKGTEEAARGPSLQKEQPRRYLELSPVSPASAVAPPNGGAERVALWEGPNRVS